MLTFIFKAIAARWLCQNLIVIFYNNYNYDRLSYNKQYSCFLTQQRGTHCLQQKPFKLY